MWSRFRSLFRRRQHEVPLPAASMGTKTQRPVEPGASATALTVEEVIASAHVGERGRAKYFHGRTRELAVVTDQRRVAVRGGWGEQGTIILFQGPPGAGKSALLAECARHAREDGWTVASIKSAALEYPKAMAARLGLQYPLVTRTGPRAEVRFGSSAGEAVLPVNVEVGGGITLGKEHEYGGKEMQDVLQVAAGKKGLLLLLDEVQELSKIVGTPGERRVSDFLQEIHNGEIDAPVILLAGGLGTSEAVFESLGISRFNLDCLHTLGQLTAEAERAIIRDWLVEEGGAQGDPAPWVDAIARQTDCWPQHIVSFAQPAAHVLRHFDGQMTERLLIPILQEGWERKVRYYEARTKTLPQEARRELAQLLDSCSSEGVMGKTEVLDAFEDVDRQFTALQLFDTALHKGVLTQVEGGQYAIPIPSMGNWLVTEYTTRLERKARRKPYVSFSARRQSRDESWER